MDVRTKLNTELVREAVVLIHSRHDRELDLLLEELIEQASTLKAKKSDAVVAGNSGAVEGHMEMQGEKDDGNVAAGIGRTKQHRYLTLQQVLRFSFQHPPLLLPVVHFQRALRSKIIGAWLPEKIAEEEKEERGCTHLLLTLVI